MNILEALFGFTDIYQKAQEKRKSRIERKHVLEKPVYGRMPQGFKQDEQPIKEEQTVKEEHSFENRETVKKAEWIPASAATREMLSDVKELLVKADEILKAYETVSKSMEEQEDAIQEVKKSLKEHSDALEEKIHSENVKSYRNVQAALDEMDKKTAKEESLVLLVSSLRTQLKCSTWFSVITLLVLIAYILFSLGVF